MPNQAEGMDALARAAIHFAVETSENPGESENTVKQAFEKDYLVLRSHRRSLQKQNAQPIDQTTKNELNSRLSQIEQDPEELSLATRLVDELTTRGRKDTDFLRQQRGILGDQDYQDHLVAGWRVRIKEAKQRLEQQQLSDQQRQQEEERLKTEREAQRQQREAEQKRKNSPDGLAEAYAKGQTLEDSSKTVIEQLGQQVWAEVPKTVRNYEKHVKSGVYAENKTRLVDAWKSSVSEESAETIAKSVLEVWHVANNGAKGNVDAEMLVEPLARLKESIQIGLGLDHQGDVVADVMVGKLIDEVISKKRVDGRVDLGIVNAEIDQMRIDEENARLAAEEAEKIRLELEEKKRIFNEKQARIDEGAEKLKGLKSKEIAEARDKISNALVGGEDINETELVNILGPEIGGRLGNITSNPQETFAALARGYEKYQYPEARIQFAKGLKDRLAKFKEDFAGDEQKGLELSQAFIWTLQQQINNAYFVGEMPNLDLVPMGMTLAEVDEELASAASSVGLDMRGKTAGSALLDILAAENLEFTDQSDLAKIRPFSPFAGGRDLETYLFVDETKRRIDLVRSLSPEQRRVWVARNVGNLMRGGGGYAQFNVRAIGGDIDAPPEETAFKNALDFVHKVQQLDGYQKRDRIHEAMGFVKPEVMSALMEVEIPVSVWLGKANESLGFQEGDQVDFELSAKDLLGVFYNAEVLEELLVARGLGKNSYTEAQGKWFRYAIYRKMGISDEQIRAWWAADPKNIGKSMVDISRTNLVSFDKGEVRNLDQIMGENWWMLIMTESFMTWGRGDYKRLPLEGVRRPWLGLRDYIADYVRTYGLMDVPMQNVSEMALWSDFLSIEVRKSLVNPLHEVIEKQTANPQIIKSRKQMLERVAILEQVSPYEAVKLGLAACGLGEFSPRGATLNEKIADWDEKIGAYFGYKYIGEGNKAKAVGKAERLGISSLRPFELWKSADLGDLDVNNWNGFDFTEMLQMAGLHNSEIERLRNQGLVVGAQGWNTFLQHASARLYSLGNGAYKDGDSIQRYLERAHAAVGLMGQLLEFDLPNDLGLPESGVGAPGGAMDLLDSAISPSERGLKPPVGDLKIPFSNYLRNAKAPIQKFLAEKFSFMGFQPNEVMHRLNELSVKLWAENSLGWKLDYISPRGKKKWVEMVEIESVGAGDNFSIQYLMKDSVSKKLQRSFGINTADATQVDMFNQRVFPVLERILNKYGYEFSGKSEVLIGPHINFVPEPTTPRELISLLTTYASSQLAQMTPGDSLYEDMKGFSDRLASMSRNGYFCWNYLIDGSGNYTPVEVVGTVIAGLGDGRLTRSQLRKLKSQYAQLDSSGAVERRMFVGDYMIEVKNVGGAANWWWHNMAGITAPSTSEIEIKRI